MSWKAGGKKPGPPRDPNAKRKLLGIRMHETEMDAIKEAAEAASMTVTELLRETNLAVVEAILAVEAGEFTPIDARRKVWNSVADKISVVSARAKQREK